MDYRQIITQNGLTLINYFNIDSVKTETNINKEHYLYANMKSGDKIWLGSYPDLDDISEVIVIINRWLGNEDDFADYEEYKSCSYETFFMPAQTMISKIPNADRPCFLKELRVNIRKTIYKYQDKDAYKLSMYKESE